MIPTRSRNSSAAFTRALALAAGTSAFAAGALAHAQNEPEEAPRTVDPSGRQPIERGAPPDPYQPPAQQQQPSQQPAQQQPAQQGDADEEVEDTGYYHYDGILGGTQPRRSAGGALPPLHEVSRGDTLWDITELYFNDPFEWPRVWSLNPHITNPHWIYPGDEVRLQGPDGPSDRPAPSEDDGGPAVAQAGGDPPSRGRSQPTGSFMLRQIAFVDRADLDVAAEVAGAPTERELLIAGDIIYLEDAGGLQPGEGYAVYTEEEKVKHPRSGKVVGAFVRLLGELEIEELREGERGVARITSSVDAVERGARVGRLKRRFTAVDPVPARTNLRGTIVATIEIGELVGENHLVVIDQGADAGVEVGNPLYVVRRGDGFSRKMGPTSQVGQDDERYPPRIVGQIRVVEVSDGTSLGWVTSSALEVGVGDRVIMRTDLD